MGNNETQLRKAMVADPACRFLRRMAAKENAMASEATILRVDVLEGSQLVVELSDGRTVQVTLTQILRLSPEQLPKP